MWSVVAWERAGFSVNRLTILRGIVVGFAASFIASAIRQTTDGGVRKAWIYAVCLAVSLIGNAIVPTLVWLL